MAYYGPKRTKVEREEQRAFIARLEREGKTIKQITDILGTVSHVQIWKDLKTIKKRYQTMQLAERGELVARTMEQLNDVAAAAWDEYRSSLGFARREFLDAATRAFVKVLEERGEKYDKEFFERLLQVLNKMQLKVRPNVKCLNTVLQCIAQMRELTGIDQPVKLDVKTAPAMDWESMVKAIPAADLEDKIAAKLREAGAPPASEYGADQAQRVLDGPRQALPYRPNNNGNGNGD
jgi:hypothetical protein